MSLVKDLRLKLKLKVKEKEKKKNYLALEHIAATISVGSVFSDVANVQRSK